jgi:hypothetical protein
MSWISNNYEKTAFGGAVVLALGLSFLGWNKYGSVQEDFGPGSNTGGRNDTGVAGAELTTKAQQSLKLDHSWVQALDDKRPVDLFTGIALFIHKNSPETPVDLIKDAPVHPPIPNKWWLDNRIDPGFGDSPERDPDGDGYSNREEYEAKTDPNSPDSFPTLIAKLMYVKDESLAWVVRPGYGDGDRFPFTYEDSKKRTNKIPAGETVAADALFFPTGVMKNRFKHLGKEVRKEMNKKTSSEEETTYVRFEDQRPNKKGVIYMVPEGLPDTRKNDFIQYDRSAVFSLEALGKNGTEFKVEENTAFALPPDAPKKDYLLKKVTASSVTLEYPDSQGNRKTVEINKGSMPQLDK